MHSMAKILINYIESKGKTLKKKGPEFRSERCTWGGIMSLICPSFWGLKAERRSVGKRLDGRRQRVT